MTWRSKIGPWVSIGVSPGVLLVGAAIAERHGGAIPLLSIALGVSLIAFICYMQGIVGIAPPLGTGQNLTAALPDYVGTITRQLLSILLALSMIGWYGFNVGLGGAALAALLNIPDFVGALILGVPIILIAIGGMQLWNTLTILTSLSSFGLILLVATNLVTADDVSVRLLDNLTTGNVLLDVAGFLGYVAVFGTRASDFTAGLQRRLDLFICIAALCTPVVIISIVGIGLQAATGSTDLVGVLTNNDLNLGNLFVAMSVIGAVFTTIYSGSLALRTVREMPPTIAMLCIGIPGLLLAILRFDRYLISWLTVLAAVLPPFAFAMMTETYRRQRGLPPLHIPLWTWLPGAILACTLVVLDVPAAVLSGVGLTVLLSALWGFLTPSSKSPSP